MDIYELPSISYVFWDLSFSLLVMDNWEQIAHSCKTITLEWILNKRAGSFFIFFLNNLNWIGEFIEEETEARERTDVPAPRCWWVTGLRWGPDLLTVRFWFYQAEPAQEPGSVWSGNEATSFNSSYKLCSYWHRQQRLWLLLMKTLRVGEGEGIMNLETWSFLGNWYS